MKTILTLTTCLCLIQLNMYGQLGHNPNRVVKQQPKELLDNVRKPSTTAANKSMATNSRLIGYRYDDYDNNNWVMEDSSDYAYTGNRGGEYTNPYGTDYDTENGHIWDGSMWEKSSLNEKTYDANNNMTSVNYRFWDSGVWQNYRREFFTYDASNRIATQSNDYWDFDSISWISDRKHIYTYDANGNVLVDEEQEWSDFTGTWRPYMKVTNTYTASGQPLTELQQDFAGSSYFDRYRTTWIYTAGNLDTVINEEYVTPANIWEFRQRSYYTYNAANQVLTQTDERFFNGIWNGDERYTSTYNGQGHQISELIEQYAGSAYENFEKLDMTVDANGSLSQTIYYTWDGTAWENDGKYLYEYNAAGSPTLNNYFSWKAGAWEEKFRQMIGYNSYNQVVSDNIMRDFFNGIVAPYARQFNYYETYEDGSTGITQIPTLTSTVLPNPFTINVAIQVMATASGNHTFEVYNMAGQRIHTESRNLAPGQQTIIWEGSDVPKGVYFYKINSASGVASGKLIKQ